MRVSSSVESLSSVPLGGLGTGSIEVTATGVFTGWTIFNNRPWRDFGAPETYLDRDDLVFILRVREEGRDPYLLILRTEPWLSRHSYDNYAATLDVINPYWTPWVRTIEAIEMEVRYPRVILEFRDTWLERSGLRVSMDLYSPIVIGDIETSSTPAVIARLRASNTSGSVKEVSVLGLLRNPHNFDWSTYAVNRELEGEGYRGVVLYGENIPETHGMYRGSMAIASVGDNVYTASTVIDFSSRWSYIEPVRRLLVDYRREGRLPYETRARVLGTGRRLFAAVSRGERLGPGSSTETVFIIAWYYPNHIEKTGQLLGHFYEKIYSSVEDVVDRVSRRLGALIERIEREVSTLYSGVYEDYLKDLATSQITTLAKSTWLTRDGFFGVWEGGPGTCAGLNTVDVAYYAMPTLVLMYPGLAEKMVLEWTEFVLSPGKRPYYEVYTLAFPENMSLYREMLKRDPTIQHDLEKFENTIRAVVEKTGLDPSGRVMHCFPATTRYVDSYDRSDLMPEYVLQALLVYEVTGDREFFERVREPLRAVIEGTLRQHDPLGLGLIYHTPPSGYEGFSQVARQLGGRGVSEELMRSLFSGPTHIPLSVNTFDNLSLHGIAAFTGDLWLSALKRVSEIFAETGERVFAERLWEVFVRARENMKRYLWNGEYFDNWYDPVTGLRDSAVMSAQLSGEWYLGVFIGSEYVFERDVVQRVLRTVYRNNYSPLEGLLNAVYPGHPRPSIIGDTRYPNNTGIPYTISSQADTPWTGLEMSVAIHMIWEGMVEEGLEILRNVHERYRSWGLYWNHLECDGHYFRALVAPVILNALAGTRVSGLRKTIEIGPRHPERGFQGPVLLPASLFHLVYREVPGGLEVVLEDRVGDLAIPLRRLVLRTERGAVETRVYHNEREVSIEKTHMDTSSGRLYIELGEDLRVREGDVVRVYIRYS